MRGRRGLLLAAVAAVVFAAAGVLGYRMAGRAGEAPKPPESGPLVQVGEILTNLDGGSREAYVQVAIELEVDSERTAEHVEERMAEVRNEVLALLRAATPEELRGAKGMETLGARVRERLNRRLREGRVLHVYFTSFVVQ